MKRDKEGQAAAGVQQAGETAMTESETMEQDGLATTQEQVSDVYKMGTIEDRGNRIE
ncbi:DUF4025 domain-containing protein [Brevibacillus brevis]|uniref:DUF4025 domain-containing protein n=1 Tax=Brevibacillus brevis TaxID=1393 RepID=A0ABY9SXT4_BREBE|nr:DUF4025 domain-containing protein [Brevibacillus brevis]WNC12637.1 DUF4025 domain-containing protein [Brevibacillus brevis]